MALKFLPEYIQPGLPLEDEDHKPRAVPPSIPLADQENLVFQSQSDAPPCPECGSIMIRNGSCYRCVNCGGTSGCS